MAKKQNDIFYNFKGLIPDELLLALKGEVRRKDEIVHSIEYETSIERLSDLDFTTDDIGTVVKQKSPLSWWLLTSVSPPVWVELTATGGPTGPAVNTVFVWGNQTVGASATTRFLIPGWGDVVAPTSAIQFRSPTAGTIKNLYIRHNTPGVGSTITYTVRINNVATSLSVGLAASGTDANNTANSAAVSVGDLIDIQITKAAITTSPQNVTAAVQVEQ